MKGGKSRGGLLKGLSDLEYINRGTSKRFGKSSRVSGHDEERLRREGQDEETILVSKTLGL